jgi:hypothetical protein
MLPDYPKLKKDISERLNYFIRKRLNHYLGPLSEIGHIRHFEGSGSRIVRPSGEEEPTQMHEIRSKEMEFKAEEVPSMTLDKILKKFDEMAFSMAEQIAQNFYKTVTEATHKAGTTVDGKQSKMSAQIILEVLSKMQIDFDTEGKARMPEIHIHPNLEEATKRALEELNKNPELKKDFEYLIVEKKEEWRAREASRKLVG